MIKEDFTKYFLQNLIDINNAYDILLNFQRNYGKDFIMNMTLDDYCIGFGRNDTYSYQLEIGTNLLGSIKGGSSYKFGVFYSKMNEDFKFYSRFSNENDALEKIKTYILYIISISNHLEILNFQHIPNLIRNKIYYLYHPDLILPIYSQSILNNFLENYGLINKCNNQDFLSKNIILKDYLLENIDNKLVEDFGIEKIIIALMYYLFSKNDINHYNIIFSDKLSDIKNHNGIGILLHKDSWNDFGYKTTYQLIMFDKEGLVGGNFGRIELGRTKIIQKSEIEVSYSDFRVPFTLIGDNFCSFAGDENFYIDIKEELGLELATEVLLKLNDLVVKDNDFIKQFKDLNIFQKSLLRDTDESYIDVCKENFNSSNVTQNKKNILKHPFGFLDVQINYLKFKYRLPFYFDFQNNSFGLYRINAIIGKNGIGKSTTLVKIAYLLTNHQRELNLLSETDEIIFGDNQDFNRASLYDNHVTKKNFSKVIGISYGLFSSNNEENNNEEDNYYGGFKFLNDTENGVCCDNNLGLSEKIKDLARNNLSDYFVQKVVNIFDNEKINNIDIKFIIKNPHKADELSSGNKVLISTIIDIVTNIKPNSLILFDEPETHLHPEFVSILIRFMYNLLEEFNSYMIIGTHSPIIIQQIPSKYVTKIVDDGDRIVANPLNIESFGNNLSEIIYDVFGGDRTNIFYKDKIIDLKNKGFNKDEILGFFNQDDIPLGLKLFVENLYSNNEI